MAVLEELGSKLTDIAGIKVSFPVQNDKDFVLKIYARLCLMYDETWDFGDSSFSLSCKKILRLLNRVGIAHLTPTSADVVDPRRLPRVWSAFLSHLEQKYGSQGLYPRLRKVLKQQQILAARREAERERQQRMAGSVHSHSPNKPQLGDISTCSSALSRDSQEDVRFAKPRPPVQKVRHASASSSGSAVSPSKGSIKSRIPVPTSMRPNLIPSGKQLARTPCLLAKSAAPPAAAASVGPTHMVQVFGSPRLMAPKAAAPSRSPPSPGNRSDSSVSDSTSSTDASPGRRRSLIPAPKTPEQTLGEYIESRLNAGFRREAAAAPPAASVSHEPSAATATATAVSEVALNVTYSAERPAAAPRVSEQEPSPAADARKAILHAAEDPAGVDDKENVRPTEAAPVVCGKPAGKAESSTTDVPAPGVRRDTFEVAPAPADREQSGNEDVPSIAPVEQPVTGAAYKSRAKKGQGEKTVRPVTDISAPESSTVAETVSEATEDRADHRPVPAQSAQEFSSEPPEEPVKKRRGRPKKDAHEPECTGNTNHQESQPEAPKKRGTRSKRDKAQDPLPAGEAAAASEIAPAADGSTEPTQESTLGVPKAEASKKTGSRVKKVKQAFIGDRPSTGAGESAAASVGGVAARPVADATMDDGGQTKASEPAPAEVQPVQTVSVAAEVPKKQRGRAQKEAEVAEETAGSVPRAAANDVMQPETMDPVGAEVSQETAEIAIKEAPKKRRGRAKKKEKLVAELPENVSSKPETNRVIECTPCATESFENQADSRNFEPAMVTEQEAPKRRRGRAKKAKPVAPAVHAAPAAAESDPESAAPDSTEEHPQPASEPSEQSAKQERALRRKAAARPQKSTDSETADGADPSWTPGTVAAGGRRGGRAAARQASQPVEAPEEAAVLATVRDRGRRTRHTEPAAESSQNAPTVEPSGRRATRASTAHTAAAGQSAGAAAHRHARDSKTGPERDSSEEPAPRHRRRLRLVLESDSEGGTPPACADVSPSPAPPQRSHRTRKTVQDSGRPRRALRALENCD